MSTNVLVLCCTALFIIAFAVSAMSQFFEHTQTLDFKKYEFEEAKLAIQAGLQQCVDNKILTWKKDCYPFE